MSDWWKAVEEALEVESADAIDPWAEFDAHALPTLSDEQRVFLEQLADQPRPIRSRDEDDD
jgi:hypothetical protein